MVWSQQNNKTTLNKLHIPWDILGHPVPGCKVILLLEVVGHIGGQMKSA